MVNYPQYRLGLRPRLNDDDIALLVRKNLIQKIDELENDDRALNEMATIGMPSNGLVVMIRMNDGGNIPHFHIMDYETFGRKFETCVRFDSNKYFHHGDKQGVLNSKQRKELVKFLQEPYGNGWTTWVMMLDQWNRNNSDRKLGLDTPMPDYTTIEEG